MKAYSSQCIANSCAKKEYIAPSVCLTELNVGTGLLYISGPGVGTPPEDDDDGEYEYTGGKVE